MCPQAFCWQKSQRLMLPRCLQCPTCIIWLLFSPSNSIYLVKGKGRIWSLSKNKYRLLIMILKFHSKDHSRMFLFFIFLMFFTILLVTVSQKVTPWANLVKCLQHIVSGPKTKVIKFFYNLCDFLSSKIHAFISIIYPWHSKYNTAKKNKSLEKPSFSKNWAKNKDLGRIKKLTSLAVLFIPARWLTVFVVLWI